MFKLFKKLQSVIERGMDKEYVSDADNFIARFDKDNPKRSDSQRREVEKHRNIFNRSRDKRVDWS